MPNLTIDRRPPKDTGVGPTTIEFTCACGNAWEAPAEWENTRIVLVEAGADRCVNCGREGSSS